MKNDVKDDIVYHYCDLSTFKAIVENNTLRLSDITKSNDSMEIKWISKYIIPLFDEEYEKVRNSKVFKSGIVSKEELNTLLSKYIDAFFGDGLNGDEIIHKTFVMCFSFERDLLSQWRGYANDGNGVAIGFDKKFLERIHQEEFKIVTPHYGNVIYTEKYQKANIRKILVKLFEEIKTINDASHKQLTLLKSFKDCFYGLIYEGIFMKSSFFKEEKEWRMCYWTPYDNKNTQIHIVDAGKHIEYNLDYRYTNNEIIPYFDMNFDKAIIKEVVLGPKNQSLVSDVEAFLFKNGYSCSVNRSNGTYK